MTRQEMLELVALRQAAPAAVRVQRPAGRIRFAEKFRRLTLRSTTGLSQRDNRHRLAGEIIAVES